MYIGVATVENIWRFLKKLEMKLTYKIAILLLSTYPKKTKFILKDICTPVGFPDSSVGIGSACNAGEPCSIPGSGRSPAEGIGYLLQHSGLENSMASIAHGVTKSWT